MNMSLPDLLIGVDLGTTGAAVAYAKPTENKVYCLRSWPDEPKDPVRPRKPRGYDKVPTMTTFDDDDKVEAWGFGVMAIPAKSIRDLHLYKLFKPRFDSEDESESSDSEKCVREFLKALLEHLKEKRKDQLPTGQNWDNSTVKFLFSYPKTWDKKTRARFSSCVNDAGYKTVGDQVTTMSLNEADASMSHFFSSLSEQAHQALLKKDEHILVADIGGGASDMSICKVGERIDRHVDLKRVVNNEGKHIGSTQIDEDFKKTLLPQLKDIYRERSQGQPSPQQLDDAALELYVDAALLHLEHNTTYVREKHNYGRGSVNGKLPSFQFPLSFPDPFAARMEDDRFPAPSLDSILIHKDDFFKAAFDTQCYEIWKQCESQMEELVGQTGQTVNHVVLAGGLGSSMYVKTYLSKKFAEFPKGRSPPGITQISDPQTAVCKGLVHNELRNIHGNPIWVYPAVASYGIQKGGTKMRSSGF